MAATISIMSFREPLMRYAKVVIVVAALSAISTAHAALNVDTGSYVYVQNFDTLATNGSTGNGPSTPWANDSTLTGWSLLTVTGVSDPTPKAVTNYYAGDGSNNTGAFYSYGTASTSDRALGGLGSGGAYFGSAASGAAAGWIAVAFQNSTGSALNSFSVHFDGEQWRNGGNTSAQTMVLQYGFGSTFAGVSSWMTPGASFNWTSPVTGSTAGAVNGNTAGLVANVGGTVDTTWNNGDTLWVRWVESNDTGNDHGLAIDNLSFSVAAVPEPETYAMLLAGLGLLGFAGRRRGQ
jgi:hypothetical protein